MDKKIVLSLSLFFSALFGNASVLHRVDHEAVIVVATKEAAERITQETALPVSKHGLPVPFAFTEASRLISAQALATELLKMVQSALEEYVTKGPATKIACPALEKYTIESFCTALAASLETAAISLETLASSVDDEKLSAALTQSATQHRILLDVLKNHVRPKVDTYKELLLVPNLPETLFSCLREEDVNPDKATGFSLLLQLCAGVVELNESEVFTALHVALYNACLEHSSGTHVIIAEERDCERLCALLEAAGFAPKESAEV